MSPISDERRAHSRHLVLLKVAVKDEDALRNLHATNLSKGGMFVATRKPLAVGRPVKVRLVHPVSEATLEISAEVVNCRKGADGEVSGCGLRFEAFDDQAQRALTQFVDGVIEPRTSEGSLAAEQAPAEGGDEDKLQAHAMMLRGMTLAHKGNLVGAAHLLARAVSLDPEQEELWQALRELEGKLESAAAERASASGEPPGPDGEPKEAPRRTSEPAVMEPAERRKAKLFFDIARQRYVAADFLGAIDWLEKAVAMDPEHAPALYALAGLVTERGEEIPRALELCRRAVDLDPDNEDYRHALESLESLVSG